MSEPSKLPAILVAGVAAVVGAYIVAFGLYNTQRVPVDLILWRHELPVWTVAALFFTVGAALMGVVTALSAVRHLRTRRATSRRIAALNEEVRRLRNAPLEGASPRDPEGADLGIRP